MKSFITILSALFFTAASYAGPLPARLSVINKANYSLRIVVDGNRYNGKGDALSWNDLSSGYHYVKIFEVRKGLFRSDRLLYSSSVYFRPGSLVNLLVGYDGRVAVDERSFDRRDNDRDRRDNDHERYGRIDDHDHMRNGDGYGR